MIMENKIEQTTFQPLLDLSVCFRGLYLYGVHSHQLVSKSTFSQDHEFLAEIYEFAEASYDRLVERHIGTVNTSGVDFISLTNKSIEKVKSLKQTVSENKEYFEEILRFSTYILQELNKVAKSPSISVGTQNMIADIADQLEVLRYKIKRRVS